MPELPEVETLRRGLHEYIIDKKVSAVEYDTEKSFPNTSADIKTFFIGATITDVKRRAKVLLIDLSSDYTLAVHLKMTGQVVYVGDERFGAGHPNDSLIGELPDKSTRVTVSFADGSHLYFNDQRKFGWMKLFPTAEVPNIKFMQTVGPEPLASDFTPELLSERLNKRMNSSIKAVLLDQAVLAGIGNIYADESLWGARIHPLTRVRDLSRGQVRELWKELRSILELAIQREGSSSVAYSKNGGKKGSYMDFARVYHREGEVCIRHPDTTIEKIKVAGRGTHICPVCQVE